MPYKIMAEGDKHCVVKKSDGKKLGCHPTREAAMKQMQAVMANESMSNLTWVDPFKYVAGAPFRIFPVGEFKRGDRTLDLTKERLAEMKSNYEANRPRWKAPIYGGHPTETQPDPPKLGNVSSLELRDDGLYALPEYNDSGTRLISDESYQYVSPGVLWKLAGAAYTDEQGNEFDNVLDHLALTNRPYFGSKTALFSSDESLAREGNLITDILSEVKSSITELFKDFKSEVKVKEKESETMTEPIVKVEDFNALKTQMETLSAERKAEAEKFAAELATAKVRADTLEAENKKQSEKLAETVKARRLDLLKTQADTFAHLPIERDEFAEKFYVLETSLPEDAKWFIEKFANFETLLAQASLFSQIARPNAKVGVETLESITEKVLTEKFDGDRSKYSEAFIAAGQLRPDLAQTRQNAR